MIPQLLKSLDCLKVISAALHIKCRTSSSVQAPRYLINEKMWNIKCAVGCLQIFASLKGME